MKPVLKIAVVIPGLTRSSDSKSKPRVTPAKPPANKMKPRQSNLFIFPVLFGI